MVIGNLFAQRQANAEPFRLQINFTQGVEYVLVIMIIKTYPVILHIDSHVFRVPVLTLGSAVNVFMKNNAADANDQLPVPGAVFNGVCEQV
jgi:hypothetical protein